jgi:hypothetical protein
MGPCSRFFGVLGPGLVENTGAGNISGVTSGVIFYLTGEPVKRKTLQSTDDAGSTEGDCISQVNYGATLFFLLRRAASGLINGLKTSRYYADFEFGVTGHSSDLIIIISRLPIFAHFPLYHTLLLIPT